MNIDALKDLLNYIKNATPEILVGAVLIALGYALKTIPKFPNKLIPVTLLVLTVIVYPLIADTGSVPYTMKHPEVRHYLFAVVIWFAAWAAHGLVLKKFIDKFMPKGPNGDTKFFADKDKPPTTTG